MKFGTEKGRGLLIVELLWQWKWQIRRSSGYAQVHGHRFRTWTRDIHAGPLNIWIIWTGK